MLLSRFWYVLLGLVLGASVFLLSMAQSMHNRAGARAMGENLQADSQVVAWYLRSDARVRSGQLVQFALNKEIAKTLQEASKSETQLPDKYREKVTAALKEASKEIQDGEGFDAVFAIDQHGRVVGHIGYSQAGGMEDFELGGYPVVADALHGFIRDDTLVWDRTYRVVGRPVEFEAGEKPAGAVVGARIIDDRFARELSKRTGAAVAFYVDGQRTAAGAPEEFPKANLDQIITDLEALEAGDDDYQEKGRSKIRELGGGTLGVQYTKLQGEAYDLGAGYAVARMASGVGSPLGFFTGADDKDKGAANWLLAAAVALGAILIGILFTILEHTVPLRKFSGEADRLARGETDQLQPSKFRGIYRKIASELNDGIDKVASTQGGVSRKAADLQEVLGDLPAQPQMAAFSFPGLDGGGDASSDGAHPRPPSAPGGGGPAFPQPRTTGGAPAGVPGSAPRPPQPTPQATPQGAPGGAMPGQAVDPEAEWKQVYEQFVALKQECGEPVDGFTYDKFRRTLVKNRDALVARHGVSQVRFTVYVKDDKAALKASPVR